MSERSHRTIVARAALRLQPDSRLVTLAREGHAAAFGEIVRRYRAHLVAFAATIVPGDRAEDVVQDSLASAHQALLRDEAAIALKPWLFAIVRNRSLNSLRDEPRHERLDEDYDGVPQPPLVIERRAELAKVIAGIQALPEAQREALVKRELEGRGHGEIASQMDITPGAVRQLIFRARTTLRDGLGVLIPVPVLRLIAEDGGTRVAAISSGAAAGAGGAIAFKAGMVTLISGIAIGGGLALDRGEERRDGPQTAVASEPNSEARAGADGGPSSQPAGGAAAEKPSSPQGEDHGGDDNSGPGSSSSGPGGGENDEGNDHSGPGGGDEHEDRSGPGSGHGDEPEEDDNSGPGGGGSSGSGSSSGSSGSGGSAGDNSGPGEGEAEPDPQGSPNEPEEPEDAEDHSGPGGGPG